MELEYEDEEHKSEFTHSIGAFRTFDDDKDLSRNVQDLLIEIYNSKDQHDLLHFRQNYLKVSKELNKYKSILNSDILSQFIAK